jgi:endoglucanase Acf2
MSIRRIWAGMCRRMLGSVGVAVAALAGVGLSEPAMGQSVTVDGEGSYYASVPSGRGVPSNSDGASVSPRVTPAFTGPVPTNKWWSSIVWPRYAGNIYGSVMHPNPLSLRAVGNGLDVALPRTPIFTGTDYYYEFNDQTRGLRVGVVGLSNADLRVDAAGDWTVSAKWSNPSNGPTLRATFGRGLPFVYAEVTGGDALVTYNTIPGPATVWANRGNVIGLTIGGTPYALFAPAGTTWTLTSTTARNSLGGKGYYSVAALPAATTAALDLFQSHAFAFVTNTRASWSYDKAASKVDTTFDFDVTSKEGGQTVPLTAMYRHHWLNSTQPVTAYTYASARGSMKLAATTQFTASMPFKGLIQMLPDVGAVPQNELYSLVQSQYVVPTLSPSSDTYFAGRSFGKVSQLVHLADQAGHTQARLRFLGFLKDELSAWLRVGNSLTGRNAYSNIEAESYDAAQGVTLGSTTTGQAVYGVGNGDWIKLSNVDFTTTTAATRIVLVYAVPSPTGTTGTMEFRVDSPTGPIVAQGTVGGTGSAAWRSLTLNLTAAANGLTGMRDVYVTCTTGFSGELFRLDYFRFDRGSVSSDRFFAYHAPWSTLLGYPDSFGSTTELNDHHFHYGYFIMAGATIAQFDPAWASASRLGGMIKLLIKDAANWERSDTRFPFLRGFDPYVGHSQASGHSGFTSGNNQESSSEAINFAAAVALWGASTGDDAIRDLGLYLYATESASIQQYWFDADNAVYPAAAPKKIAGIVWDSGIAYGTWFSGEPEMIHGINFLPITSATLGLGVRPDQVLKSYNIMTAARGGPPIYWQFTHWCALALADGAQALSLLNANPSYNPDNASETKAEMVHWIKSMNALGPVDAAVTADWPHYAVFKKNGARTFVAWNPTAAKTLVTFSTGRTACVAPGETLVVRDADASTVCCAADVDGSGGVDFGDFLAFFNCYDTGGGCADVDGNPGVDFGDFLAFFNGYDAGC